MSVFGKSDSKNGNLVRIAGPPGVSVVFCVLTVISTVIILGPWHGSHFIAAYTEIRKGSVTCSNVPQVVGGTLQSSGVCSLFVPPVDYLNC